MGGALWRRRRQGWLSNPWNRIDVVRLMPFVGDIAHDERMVETNRAFRKSCPIAKVG